MDPRVFPETFVESINNQVQRIDSMDVGSVRLIPETGATIN